MAEKTKRKPFPSGITAFRQYLDNPSNRALPEKNERIYNDSNKAVIPPKPHYSPSQGIFFNMTRYIAV